jgi:hypothetical protein
LILLRNQSQPGNKPAPESREEQHMKARDIKGTKSAKIIEQQGRVLPKTLFAKYEWGNDDPYLEADEHIENHAEKGETVYVGEYKLVKVHKVSLNLKVA